MTGAEACPGGHCGGGAACRGSAPASALFVPWSALTRRNGEAKVRNGVRADAALDELAHGRYPGCG